MKCYCNSLSKACLGIAVILIIFSAIKCVSALVENPNDKQIQRIDGHKFDVRHALVCLAAQHALEKCQRDVAMATLQHLASSGRNDKAKLTANRFVLMDEHKFRSVKLVLVQIDQVERQNYENQQFVYCL